MSLLEIKDLHAEVPGREILKGVDLVMTQGEVPGNLEGRIG